MPLKVSVNDAKSWRNLMSAIATMVEEAEFEFNSDGMQLRSMDESHVAMVEFTMTRGAFETFECTEPVRIRLSLTDLVKKLRSSGSDALEMSYDDQTRKLNMILKGKWRTTFTVPVLDPGAGNIPVPKIAFNSMIRMASSNFQDILSQAETVAQNIKFETSKDKLIAEASSEISSVKAEMGKEGEALRDLDVKEPSTAVYNLNFLVEVSKAGVNVADLVTLELSTDMPIRVTYETEGKWKLTYYIAPRIEPA